MQLKSATTLLLLGTTAVLVRGRPQSANEGGCGIDREGVRRQVGDSWSPDGCNNCRCLPSGIPGCTRRICSNAENWEEGRTCSEGKTWEEKTGKDLKVCTCIQGTPSCTDKVTKAVTSTAQCGEDSDGNPRRVGDAWKEECNNCRCTSTGVPVCTLRFCVNRQEHECVDERGNRRQHLEKWEEWEEAWGEEGGEGEESSSIEVQGEVNDCSCNNGEVSCQARTLEEEQTGAMLASSTGEVQQCVDMDGATREEGESWTEDCNNCMCTKSGKSCTKRLCNFSLPFLSSSPRAEEVSGCLDSEGTRRQEGESWDEDCNSCMCTNSRSSCTKRLCNFAAPFMSVRTDEGFQCLDREETTREIGESWTEDCNNCMCTKSGSSCTKKLCNFELGLSCTDEQNITRQHSESWMKVASPPEIIKEIADVQLVWLSDLSMEIQLDENTTDVIVLAATSNIPGEETPCLFSGKVGKDQDSLVSVSGCRGDEEVTVSIASRRIQGGFVDLTISEGTTFEVRVVGSFFERSTCICTDGEISCAVQVPIADPPSPPQPPTAPLLGSAPRLPSAPLPQSAPRLPSAPELPSVPKVHFPTDEAQQRRIDFKSTSGSTYSLLIVVDETSDKAQCNQAGVTRCRGVITWEMLRSLKAGATMDLVAGEGVLMTLRRDPEVTISGGVSLSFLLSDGGEGNIVVGTNGSMYGSIKPLTGSVHYTLESCGRGCAVLIERPSDWFNQFQD